MKCCYFDNADLKEISFCKLRKFCGKFAVLKMYI
jgi:hypothetical protein